MLKAVFTLMAVLVTAGELLAQGEDLTITVRLLDPRVVTNTAQSMSIEWGEAKATTKLVDAMGLARDFDWS